MGAHLADSPVSRQRLQAQVGQAEIEPSGQLDGAHHVLDRQFDVHQLGLGGQKRVVEPDVVGDQRAPPQHLDEVGRHVTEGRLTGQHLGGQAVHMGGTGVDAGVQQAVQALLDVAVVAESQRRDTDDARLTGPETRRLDVHHSPAGSGLVGGSSPLASTG